MGGVYFSQHPFRFESQEDFRRRCGMGHQMCQIRLIVRLIEPILVKDEMLLMTSVRRYSKANQQACAPGSTRRLEWDTSPRFVSGPISQALAWMSAPNSRIRFSGRRYRCQGGSRMLTRYIQAAMQAATIERLPDDD